MKNGHLPVAIQENISLKPYNSFGIDAQARYFTPFRSEDELEEMAALPRIRMYPPDQVLCREGAFEDLFYIVADGSAVITKKINEDEGERILRIVGRGDLVGEMSMIQKAPRSATVRTYSEFTVLEMEKKDFETMLGQSSRMAIDIIRTTLDRMRENDQMTIGDLQKTNKVLRQLDRNKLEFIQVAAHELRTPLTVLKGYVNVLNTSSYFFIRRKKNSDFSMFNSWIFLNEMCKIHNNSNTSFIICAQQCQSTCSDNVITNFFF